MMDISQLSDAELLSRVAAGDAAAEEALAERYGFRQTLLELIKQD